MRPRHQDHQDEKPVLSHIHGKAGAELVDPLCCVALPNGNIAISQSSSSQLTFWNPETQQCINTIDTKSEICDLKLWTNNRLLVTNTKGKKPFIYDITTGLEDLKAQPFDLKWEKNRTFGSVVEFSNGNLCEFFKGGLGFYKPAFTVINSPYSGLGFKPTSLSNKCLITFREEGNSIFIFNMEQEKFVKEVRLRDDKFKYYDAAIAVLPNQHFALTLRNQKNIEIYRVNEIFDLALVKILPTIQLNLCVAALPDNKHFITTNCAGQIELWNLQSDKQVDTFQVGADVNNINYLKLIAVRPHDGKVVYITEKYNMGVVEYACMRDYLSALELEKVLFEMQKVQSGTAYFPVDIVNLIRQFYYENNCFQSMIPSSQFFKTKKSDTTLQNEKPTPKPEGCTIS